MTEAHNYVWVRKLSDEEQGSYVVWDSMYECTKCGSIDLDVPQDAPGCGPKLYYGLTPEIWVERYGTEKPV